MSDDLVPKEDVLGDRQFRDERELLVDDDDAARSEALMSLKMHFLAVENDRALVGTVRVDTGKNLHER